MIRPSLAAAAAAALSFAFPAASHAADTWRSLGSTTTTIATDGEHLVVTSPEAGRLLVRDDRTGKAWRLALPAGCAFTGIVGGGNAAAECGLFPTDPTYVSQQRYVLVGLTSGATRELPPVRTSTQLSEGVGLEALGSRWAEYGVGAFKWSSRSYLRLADLAWRTDSRSTTASPDLGSLEDQPVTPLCVPAQREVDDGGDGGTATAPERVLRGGAWVATTRHRGPDALEAVV